MTKREIHDFYFHKAKKEKFSARSVYKLKNIQEKYHLIAPGNHVLDLGGAPGSWSEYVAPLLKRNGHLWTLDQRELSSAAQNTIKASEVQFHFLKQSVFDPLTAFARPLDVVLSDMAPMTQGNRTVDTERSRALCDRAFEIAKEHLKTGGHFVSKLFQSDDTIQLSKSWVPQFRFAKLYRPPAVQKESKEIYFIGMHLLR